MSRPQAFGHYDLLDRVNVGGMAEVFRARDRDSGEICAVKRILPEVAEDEEFVRMFRDEARLARVLEHPNIARILDLGRVEGTYFLALQFVDGHDLRTLFDHQARKREPVPLEFLVHVLIKVCEGLEYAHQKKDQNGRSLNLVHRDVSPQNILVGFDGDVKLIDFGIAKSSMKLSKTQVGTIKGKYAYMSPEQVRGLPLDHRSDLFSLGICAWELSTLHRLFASDNEMLIMERVKDAELSPPRRIQPTLPVEIDRIVMRALSRDVDERYGSAADLKADLQAFAYAADLKWGREDVATYMRQTFASEKAGAEGPSAGLFAGEGSGLNPSGVHPGGGAMNGNSTQLPTKPSAQELVMADNKGSDLDVFEGLAAKPTSTRRPTTSAAPPPPPVSSRSAPPPPAPPPRRNATQMGIGMPLPPVSSPPLTAPPRTSTPPIAPPPSRSPLSVAPAKSAAPAAPNPRGAMVDMDWDDEDEKTHVYDKDIVGQMAKSSAGLATPPPMQLPTPRPPSPPSGNLKQTMVGVGAPLPPPSRSDRPLAPPSRPPSRVSSGGMPAAALPPPAAPPGAPFAQQHAAPFPQAPSAPQQMAATLPLAAPPPPAPSQTPLPAVVAPAPQPVMGPQFVGNAPAMTPMPRQIADQTQVIRPKGGSSTLLIVGGVLFAGAAAVGAYLWASNRPGNIVVSVDPPPKEVSVQVDGVERCKDSSCRVEVSPGAHIVKVIAGDFTSQKQVTVEPAKDVVVPITIQVSDSPKEASTDSPKVPDKDDKTVLKIGALQDGVKVSVDGGDTQGLPLTMDSIKPGKHHLKFTGSKFKTAEMDINVEEGSTKKLDSDDIKVMPTAVAMKFTIAAKGAKGQVSDGAKKQDISDGKSVDLDPDKSYVVTATAPGFEDFTAPLKLGNDADQTFKVDMVEKGKPAIVATNTATAVPKPTGDPTPKPTSDPTPKPAGGDGTLFINTLPKSNCVVNGTPRGATPITITVPAGTYSVTCVAKDGDEVLKKGGSATVPAGGKGTLTLKLRD